LGELFEVSCSNTARLLGLCQIVESRQAHDKELPHKKDLTRCRVKPFFVSFPLGPLEQLKWLGLLRREDGLRQVGNFMEVSSMWCFGGMPCGGKAPTLFSPAPFASIKKRKVF